MNTNFIVAREIREVASVRFPVDYDNAMTQVCYALMTLPTVSYQMAVREAMGLLESDCIDENPEYLRGMCELIARLFGDSYLGTEGDTDAGRGAVEDEIRANL